MAMSEEDSKALTKIIEDNKQKAVDNQILRAAARIIHERTKENPGVITVKVTGKIEVELTANYKWR